MSDYEHLRIIISFCSCNARKNNNKTKQESVHVPGFWMLWAALLCDWPSEAAIDPHVFIIQKKKERKAFVINKNIFFSSFYKKKKKKPLLRNTDLPLSPHPETAQSLIIDQQWLDMAPTDSPLGRNINCGQTADFYSCRKRGNWFARVSLLSLWRAVVVVVVFFYYLLFFIYLFIIFIGVRQSGAVRLRLSCSDRSERSCGR